MTKNELYEELKSLYFEWQQCACDCLGNHEHDPECIIMKEKRVSGILDKWEKKCQKRTSSKSAK